MSSDRRSPGGRPQSSGGKPGYKPRPGAGGKPEFKPRSGGSSYPSRSGAGGKPEFKPRGAGSYSPRPGADRGGPPREGGFKPRTGGSSFAPRPPREGGFKPREEGAPGRFPPRDRSAGPSDRSGPPRSDFKPRGGSFKPRPGGDRGGPPREGGFKPRGAPAAEGRFKPRTQGYTSTGVPRAGFKPRSQPQDEEGVERFGPAPRSDFKPRDDDRSARPPREGGFKPRSGDRDARPPRGGDRDARPPRGGDRDARPPREGGFKPRGEGRPSSGPPREGGFKPRPGGDRGGPPRSGGYQPRDAAERPPIRPPKRARPKVPAGPPKWFDPNAPVEPKAAAPVEAENPVEVMVEDEIEAEVEALSGVTPEAELPPEPIPEPHGESLSSPEVVLPAPSPSPARPATRAEGTRTFRPRRPETFVPAPAEGEVAAVVSRRGVERIAAGHPWIYESDVVDQSPSVHSGDVVRVLDGRGWFMGRAYLSLQSKIRLRMLTREEVPVDRAFFAERLASALRLRELIFPGSQSYRLVHGEADKLPGLVVDRYGDHLSIQLVSQGAEVRRALWVELLEELLKPVCIVERSDVKVRAFEGLEPLKQVLKGTLRNPVEYVEGSVTVGLDLLEGQKTGSFLDQRENHLMAGQYARGRCLDCFAYGGSFALQMAKAGGEVTAVEISESASAQIKANAERNGLKVNVVTANAFDWLRDQLDAGERYDTIVLDPPAFAKSKDSVEAAIRGYKEINLRALQLLRPGGTLITSSCSYHIPELAFEELLAAAAADSKRDAQIVEKRGASRDHPVLLGLRETRYLKCFVLRVP